MLAVVVKFSWADGNTSTQADNDDDDERILVVVVVNVKANL